LIFLLFKKIYETHMLKRCLTQRLDEKNPEKYLICLISGTCGFHPTFETKTICG